MPTTSSMLVLVAEYRNPLISRESDGSSRLYCDLKIGRHQVLNGVALYGTARRLFNLSSPTWIQARGVVLSVLPPTRARPMFNPVPHDPFCIDSFELLAGEPRHEDLSVLVHDHRFGWVSEKATAIAELDPGFRPTDLFAFAR